MSRITYTGVVAMAADRAIGRGGTMPWQLREDLRLFKRLTLGHPVLMGRKTWESLGRPLPGRQNIVLTRDPAYRAEGAQVIRELAELEALPLQDPEVMVIGGAQIYALLLPQLTRLHVSEVAGHYPADTYFPAFEHLLPRRRELERFEGFVHVLRERA
ncbi:MAG: dihydrofolate reductase [Akkermansia sp.]